MIVRALVFLLFTLLATATCNILEDPLGYSSSLEIVHLFYGQFPVGIAVSASGRKFTCYPAGFDEQNTNNGTNNAIQVSELTTFDSETPYPNAAINNPPNGSIDFSGPYPRTKGLSNYFLGVQAVVIDFLDTLWILDTGRVSYAGVMLESSPGGPKLVSIDLTNDTIIRIFTFPTSVAKPISYFSDVRFDTLRGFAFIADASPGVQANALVVVDLESGDSWRVLERDLSVIGTPGFVPFIYGDPVYTIQRSSSGEIVGVEFITIGVGGVALSPDTDTLYYSAADGRYLFSVPTALLRNRFTPGPEIVGSVRNLGEKGWSAAIVSDSLGLVYGGNFEQDGVFVFDPRTGFAVLLVRDKMINFVSRFSVGEDGYLYFMVNQLHSLPAFYPGRGELGEDRRQKPYVVLRIKLPGNATKGPGS